MSPKVRLLMSSVLGVAGIALAASVDWRIALGVFFLQWAHNVDRHHKAG